MVKTSKIIILFGLISITSSVHNHVVYVMMGYMYPLKLFYNVQQTCQQLLDDLTIILSDTTLAEQFFTKTPYVYEQCCALQTAIELLCAYNEDLYLTEEITALLATCVCLHETFEKVCTVVPEISHNENYREIRTMLAQAYHSLQYLLTINQEVVLTTPRNINPNV